MTALHLPKEVSIQSARFRSSRASNRHETKGCVVYAILLISQGRLNLSTFSTGNDPRGEPFTFIYKPSGIKAAAVLHNSWMVQQPEKPIFKPRLLVVDDEESIRTGLTDLLIYHGYDVSSVSTGEEAIVSIRERQFDAIILDLMLPGVGGYQVCNEVREKDREIPIIMLTARTADEDIINGFLHGADDYVTKPFSLRQFLLRLEAIMRRGPWRQLRQGSILLAGGVEVSIPDMQAIGSRGRVSLTRREIDLLLYLKRNESRTVGRDELLREVWGYERASAVETRTVDIHIAKLRKKIELDPKDPKIVVTLRNEGYRLVSIG